MNRELSPIALQRAAVVLCVSVLALMTLGTVMLCSTSSFFAQDRFGDPYYLFKRQLLWLGVGLGACAVTASVDYRRYRSLAWAVLAAAVVLLIAVLLFGPVRNGARRWLAFGPVNFQVSELAKVALVIFLAFWLEKMHRIHKDKLTPRILSPWWGLGAPLLVTGLLAALILRQPDLGTALMLIAVAFALLWIAGAAPFWLGATAGIGLTAAAAVLTLILQFGMFDRHYQVQRIIAWWHGTDPQGVNFQQTQALLAFGSGGPLGVGLGDSRQKMFYLPEAHTDFIPAIIGEELGLAGSLFVVIAFALLVVSGGILAARAPDLFGVLLGSGIVILIALQSIINLAVVTNSIPNKGMPLPFISYGGSNLLMMLASVGILLNIYRQAHSQLTGRYLETAPEKVAVSG